MIDILSLSLILIHAISAEAPLIETDARYDKYKTGEVSLLESDYKVVNENDDYLINPDVDLNIIANIQLFESRLRPNTKDGDCTYRFHKTGIGKATVAKMECRSVGNMQISRGAVKWIQNIDFNNFKDLTIDELKTPEMNARVGYAILKNFKATCKSTLPGVWITAFGEGKCPKNNQLDSEGIRRCAVLTAQLKASNSLPENWKCGNEGKKMKDPTALKFIAKIEELNKKKLDVETAKN